MALATGIVKTVTSEGGTILPTDDHSHLIPFDSDSDRYGGALAVGDTVSYHHGHDSNGRIVARAVTITG